MAKAGQRTTHTADRHPYPYVGGDNDHRDPDYDRVVASLSDRDLADELELCRGDDGYREALAREALARNGGRT